MVDLHHPQLTVQEGSDQPTEALVNKSMDALLGSLSMFKQILQRNALENFLQTYSTLHDFYV